MFKICLQILSSKHQTYFEFSLGAAKQTPIDGNKGGFKNKEHNNLASEGPCDSQKHCETGYSRLKSEIERTSSRLLNKSKEKRHKRQERNTDKQKSLKIYGINSARLSSKLESFENVLKEVNPSIFCIQETQMKRSILISKLNLVEASQSMN